MPMIFLMVPGLQSPIPILAINVLVKIIEYEWRSLPSCLHCQVVIASSCLSNSTCCVHSWCLGRPVCGLCSYLISYQQSAGSRCEIHVEMGCSMCYSQHLPKSRLSDYDTTRLALTPHGLHSQGFPVPRVVSETF